MREQKRSDKESMIYLTPKPSQKIFQNNWSFFMASIKLQTSLDYMGCFRKQNTCNSPAKS